MHHTRNVIDKERFQKEVLMHTKAMQIVYLLFEDIKYRQEDNKYKPLHEIQKLVAERFKEITGLTAPHSDFLSVCRTFVNILKKRHNDTF